MAKNAHLTFDERQTIEVSLRDNLKFKEIGEIIRKDPSTISKEARFSPPEKRPPPRGQSAPGAPATAPGGCR